MQNLPCVSLPSMPILSAVGPGASGPLTPKSVSLGTGELYSSSVSDRHNSAPTIPDYEVLRLIGRGAYGEVWLARSTTGLYRAVKVVHRAAFDHDRPFEREFDGIQKFEPISHSESQVHILHVGRNDAGGYFYYVMELADQAEPGPNGVGRASPGVVEMESQGSSGVSPSRTEVIDPASYVPKTLKYELHARGRLPFEECVQIGLALTNALAHLHKNGLVHRDVKPSNIIFVNGVPKLADIGLVTSVDATRSFVGTEGYLAPEGPGTAQADLYSLGKVLYEISTGLSRREFPALPDDIATVADRQHLSELNAVIVKACQVDPSDRYQLAAEMRADLELLQEGRSVKRHRGVEAVWARLKKAALATSLIGVLVAAIIFTRQKAPQPLDPLTTGRNVGGYPPTTMRGTRNLEAWNHYKLGWSARDVPQREGTVSAENEFREAIRLDPKFTLAYWGLFRVQFSDTWDLTHTKAPAEFRGLAAKMVELDNGLAETHLVLGFIRFWEWNWVDADREYREALRLNPDCTPARIYYGWYLAHAGRTRESLTVLERARQVDPTSAHVLKMMGHPYFVDRDFTNALAYYQESYRIDPSYEFGHFYASLASIALKDYPRAVDEWEACQIKHGDDPLKIKRMCDELRQAFREHGERGYWLERLEQAKATMDPNDEPYEFAKIYARMSDTEESFKYLEKAYDRHDELIYLIFDDCWDTWRDKDRFKALITRIGLAELEREWLHRLADGRIAEPRSK